MTRGTRTRLTLLLAAALVALAGCSGDNASSTPNAGPATHTPAALVRVAATLHIPAAGNVVTTPDRLWVISGGKTVVTQIDPAHQLPSPEQVRFRTLSPTARSRTGRCGWSATATTP